MNNQRSIMSFIVTFALVFLALFAAFHYLPGKRHRPELPPSDPMSSTAAAIFAFVGAMVIALRQYFRDDNSN